jgi:N-acetylmuramoyl-L-alanine amidase
MNRRWIALAVLMAGLTGFMLMQSDFNVQALSPQFSSLPLHGRIVGVDAGHGGYDGGCVGRSGVPEKEFNLAVTMLVKAELEKQGATVVLSRDEDVALIDPVKTTGYKKRKELDNRLKIFAENNVECMVSIHMNKYRNERQRGPQVFYKKGEESGKALAGAVQDALMELDPDHCREHSVGDYYILNACPASALVECGFLSNEEEEQQLLTDAYREKLAKAIVEGVAVYFDQMNQQAAQGAGLKTE